MVPLLLEMSVRHLLGLHVPSLLSIYCTVSTWAVADALCLCWLVCPMWCYGPWFSHRTQQPTYHATSTYVPNVLGYLSGFLSGTMLTAIPLCLKIKYHFLADHVNIVGRHVSSILMRDQYRTSVSNSFEMKCLRGLHLKMLSLNSRSFCLSLNVPISLMLHTMLCNLDSIIPTVLV